MKRFATSLILLSVISCTKDNINSSKILPANNRSSAVLDSFYVGEKYGGGIIFYIDASGQHGLIAAKVDLGGLQWYNGVFNVTGATGKNLGDGQKNTHKIIAAQGKSGSYAALACAKYKASGFSDWYLPSQQELLKLSRSNVIPTSATYWSSSETDSVNAIAVLMDDSYFYPDPKSHDWGVRPIRSF